MAQKKLYRQVFIRDIENGMVIAKDVLNSKGEILLAEGFKIVIAITIKRLLSQHGIVLVNVFREEVQPSVQEPTHDKTETDIISVDYDKTETDIALGDINKRLTKIVNRFNDSKEGIRESFDKFAKGEKIEESEIKEEIKGILEVFEGNVNVFQIMQNVKYLDDIVYSHCYNVSLISYTIGSWLELDGKDLKELALSGMLIDIGKTQIDEGLLNKKGALTKNEFKDLKEHSILGYEMIKDYDFISEKVKRAVLLHHERSDGSGYPLGLEGDGIPLFAKIVAIADVYNALVSDRPHRGKKTPFEAIKVLETEYMDKLDTGILYLFLRRIASNYIGQRILLSNYRRGEIVFIPKYNIHRPIIRLQENGEVIDLGDNQFTHLDVAEFY